MEMRALEEGRAFLVRERTRMARVLGRDAHAWLQDLVTADVDGLTPLGSRRSLLLSPTGRIRADFHVLRARRSDDGFVLVQSEDQPTAVADLLAPYVLSSDVDLVPATLLLVSAVGEGAEPGTARDRWSPSVLGAGFDLLADGDLQEIRRDLSATGLVEVGSDAVEAWRVRRGVPRFPVDLNEDSLPAEASLDDGVVIDRSKGCFLGQESVAKVRNLGHPARIVLALRSSDPVDVGEPVLADGAEIGLVTSANTLDGRTAAIARVRWDARERELRTASGARLRPR